MRHIGKMFQLFPAFVFLGLAVFYVLKLALALSPTNPLSWQVYLAASGLFSGVASFVPEVGLGSSVLMFLLLAAAGLAFSPKDYWLRFRFAYTHAALGIVAFSAMDGSFRSASLGAPTSPLGWTIPQLGQISFMHMLFMAGVTYACFTVHRRVVWRLRHPVRTVQPLVF